MKHFVSVVCLLLLSNFAFSQSNEQLHQIKPKWKLGDLKKVHTKSFTKTFINDSLFNNTEATSNYSIKVIDTVRNYTLLFSNEPNSIDIETKSSYPQVDSIINSLVEIIKKIEKETNTFKYELLVDKNTGMAFEVKNSDKFLKLTEQVTSSMIDELGQKKGKPKIEIENMKQKVIEYFKLSEPKILETIINQFNYIMQPYSYTFPYNSTVSNPAMIHDVNALGEFGDIEIPAIVTISSKKDNNRLTIKTDTEYDNDFLLEQIKKKYENLSELKTSDIFLSEKEEAIFTDKTNWIVSQKSVIIFKTKEVKVINETLINFQ